MIRIPEMKLRLALALRCFTALAKSPTQPQDGKLEHMVRQGRNRQSQTSGGQEILETAGKVLRERQQATDEQRVDARVQAGVEVFGRVPLENQQQPPATDDQDKDKDRFPSEVSALAAKEGNQDEGP